MKTLQILLVDDEPLLLESLEIILTHHKMKITGTAQNGLEALSILSKKTCDLALVDLNMKGMGGIELIATMKSQYPTVKILVLTTFYDDNNITQAISNGADGYLLKDSGKDAILGAISQIMEGRNVIDSKVMQRLAVLVSGKSQKSVCHNVGPDNDKRLSYDIKKCPTTYIDLVDTMTNREKEICTLLAQGLTNRQIADMLYISEGTVKNYISSIYDKTGIHDRVKLIVAING